MATSSVADRGKGAEKKVKDWLEKLNTSHASFAWMRLPDARQGRGRIAAMPADFLVQVPRGVTFLEVKEIEHTFRVPHANIPQLALLKKWALAGSRGAVLILFKPLGKWRCMDARNIPTITKGSWDFSDEPLYDTPHEAFTAVFGEI